MTERARRGRWLALLASIVGFVVTTTVLVQLIAPRMSWQKPCPDYVCYWAAGNLLAHGESPYDFAKLERLEQEYGWNKDTDGLGVYAFSPTTILLPCSASCASCSSLWDSRPRV